MMKRGFTLVELSIVLVVIGLLIGGILVAQSMISAAKLQSLVRTIQQYDIAAVNFETKYNGSIPGDTASFPQHSVNVNNNGVIDTDGHIFQKMGNLDWMEFLYFWQDLSQAGLISEQFINYSGPVSFSGDFSGLVPKLNYGQGCYLNAFTDFSSVNFGNYWTITGGMPDALAACMTASEAFAIDAKLDDGKPTYGGVRTMNQYSGPGPAPEGDAYYGCAANSANNYDIDGQWGGSPGPYESPMKPNRVECLLAIKAQW